MNIIKKLIGAFIVFLTLFTVGKADNVTLSLTENVTSESTEVIIKFKNETGKCITQPHICEFEKLVDNQWIKVSESEYEASDVYFRRYPLAEDIISYPVSNLESGCNYRITLSYNMIQATDSVPAKASLVFTVN